MFSTKFEFLDYIKNLEVDVIKTTYNIPCAFDIETSSFYDNGEKRGIMYIWMFGIDEKTVYGRTWEEFIDLMEQITDILHLDKNNRLRIYVHNLSYEFGFISRLFVWDKVFAVKERKVLVCRAGGIEFRCSYLLSGLSLEKTAENLKVKVRKKTGQLNYDLVRHFETPLNKKELEYCEYDILCVLQFIRERIERDGNIEKIPLTKTGYVRSYCRNMCLYDKDRKIQKTKYTNYRNYMKALSLEEQEYTMAKNAFMGGFTHANAFMVDKIIKNVFSYDFTSSYPARMILSYYPVSKGRKVEVKTKEDFNFYLKNYCCIFEIEFEDLEDIFHYDNYLSKSKCEIEGNFTINNGRIVRADKLRTCITELDYFIISKCYKYKKKSVRNFWIYERGKLPKPLIESVIKFYKDKTELKEIEGSEEIYLNSKEMLNAIYGMIVTAIIHDDFLFTENGWKKEESSTKEIEKYNRSAKRFTSYLWGIYITAHARFSLWEGIFELKEDYIYSDTDSVKGVNLEKHIKWFNEKNEKIKYELKQAMEYYNLPIDSCSPKNKKGKECTIGLWDFEHVYKLFKTLGAKRYITYISGQPEITVAGLGKKQGRDYLVEKYGKIGCFEHFNDELFVPSERTGKMTISYIDFPTYGKVTDYIGQTVNYKELSSIHMEKQEYSLNISDDFVKYYKKGIYEGDFKE